MAELDFAIEQPKHLTSLSFYLQLTLHHRGHGLVLNVYEKAAEALSDDYEAVRMAAVKLIWVLSHVYPGR